MSNAPQNALARQLSEIKAYAQLVARTVRSGSCDEQTARNAVCNKAASVGAREKYDVAAIKAAKVYALDVLQDELAL